MVIPGNPLIKTGIDVFSIPVWKRGDPICIWGIVDPRYHTVIPGNPCIWMGINVISIPVWKRGVPVPIWGFVNPRWVECAQRQGGKFWFLGQNFRWCAGAPVTQGKVKTPIPITIQGVPVPEQARRQKKSHMGSPRSWKEFVTIWEVTNLLQNSICLWVLNTGWLTLYPICIA